MCECLNVYQIFVLCSPSGAGRFCTGKKAKYRHCNTKSCPTDAEDFRLHQCAEYNSQIRHYKVPDGSKWIPKYDGSKYIGSIWSILYQVALYSKDLSDNVSGYCGIIIICRVLVLVYLLSQLTRTFNVIKYKFQVILMCIYIEFHSF